MDKIYRSHSGYFNRAFDSLDAIVDEMRIALEGVEYDTMVGTGLSGTLVIPTLARTFGTRWAIVRKEYSPHTNSKIEGEIGHKWLFVDDFISSGETLRRVQSVISDIKWEGWDYTTQSHKTEYIDTEYVGSYLYERKEYKAPGKEFSF